MNRRIKHIGIIAVVAISLLIVYMAYSLMPKHVVIKSSGTVKAVGVEVYWDIGANENVTSIDWGMLDPGSSNATDVWIKSTSNTNITLTMNTSNWNPSNASNYILLSWNYTGATLQPHDIIPVTLTLTVSADIKDIRNFTFDIIISAEG